MNYKTARGIGFMGYYNDVMFDEYKKDFNDIEKRDDVIRKISNVNKSWEVKEELISETDILNPIFGSRIYQKFQYAFSHDFHIKVIPVIDLKTKKQTLKWHRVI